MSCVCCVGADGAGCGVLRAVLVPHWNCRGVRFEVVSDMEGVIVSKVVFLQEMVHLNTSLIYDVVLNCWVHEESQLYFVE